MFCKTLLRYTTIITLNFSSFALHADSSKLSFHQVWIAEAPPVSKVLAAYMMIKNDSAIDISVTSAVSDSFSSTAFHRTIHQDGVAKMQHQGELTILANSQLELKPGSFHMMLFNPVKPFIENDSIDLMFISSDGGKHHVTAIVKKASFLNHQHHNH